MLLMNNKIKTGGFLNDLTEREQILNSYSDEYIEKVINNSHNKSLIIYVLVDEYKFLTTEIIYSSE